jgi:hypothetical protein
MNRSSHQPPTLSSPQRLVNVPLALAQDPADFAKTIEAGDPGLPAAPVLRTSLAQTVVARVAGGVAAVALSVLTVALLVIAPAQTRPAGVEVEAVPSNASAPVFASSVKRDSALGIRALRGG